jgi:predicted enzyme related to lactoylglutathione lyase
MVRSEPIASDTHKNPPNSNMSEADQTMGPKKGHFSWNELITTDTKASAEFYRKLFGWQSAPFVPKGAPSGGPPYLLFKTDASDMGAGGMMQAPAPGIPTHWLPYVVVDNVDMSLAKAVELGAKACTPVMAIGEVGRVAVIQDPLGATIGLHELPR